MKYSMSKYRKYTPIQHILNRPDMYCGSTKPVDQECLVSDPDDGYQLGRQNVRIAPALIRIIVEALSNAIDNVGRSKSADVICSRIDVSIDSETGVTSIKNDGLVVPITQHDSEKCYNHSLIFGQLLTGSNYDDSEKREDISGRNGVGVKLTNVFSNPDTGFTVEGVDPSSGKKLVQTWTNNMQNTSGPKVTSSKIKSGYTKVTWSPDFPRFGLEGYTPDIVKLYTRFVVDAAMLTKVPVYLNGVRIPAKSLTDYVGLYPGVEKSESILLKGKSSEAVLIPSHGKPITVSFVNGVFTKLGGQHVDAWTEAIFRPLLAKFQKKDGPAFNIKDLKPFFSLFVVASVDRPEFDSQDKNKLEAPTLSIGAMKAKEVNAIMKWSTSEDIKDMLRSKELLVLKKAERRQKKFVKIDGLDGANNAGTKHSQDCTLILCEGLSAKTYAVAGISKGAFGKAGRDWFGILPLRGKLLNVRNASPAMIAKNSVVTDIIKAIGLHHEYDYTQAKNLNTLYYGRVMLMTDADVDGIHIEGLVLNMIQTLFPTLFNSDRQNSFLVSMKTPIARIKRRPRDLLFYDENRFKKYIDEAPEGSKLRIKYYKGLGTTKAEDVPDTFAEKIVSLRVEEADSTALNTVFHKSLADTRKVWLGNFVPGQSSFSLDDLPKESTLSATDFVNNELVKFSHDDCKRSIPGMDGLKEGQRKILYALKKRKMHFTSDSVKVAQLGGYIAEHSNYHHGEQNLYDTLVKMAQEYPGSNNIPLMYRDGMFGTRLEGGKDAASARYIYTRPDRLTELLYMESDDPILDRVVDDGDLVQPVQYTPILPMHFINGCLGIGTGWSSTIPCYNPEEMIKAILTWLDNDGDVMIPIDDDEPNGEDMCIIPEPKPWYRGYKGAIEKISERKYQTTGVFERKAGGKKPTVIVRELPIGMWTNRFKEICEDLLEAKQIHSFKNYSTPKEVNFEIVETPDGIECNLKTLKLTSTIATSNIVVFDENEQLRRYPSIMHGVNEFCKVRIVNYEKRKAFQISNLGNDIRRMGNKERFIRECIAVKPSKKINESDVPLDIFNEPEAETCQELENRGYDREDGNYGYLLKLEIRTFSAEKVAALQKDIENKKSDLATLSKFSAADLWRRDIKAFQKEYPKFLSALDKGK